jgi:hypothetical protein
MNDVSIDIYDIDSNSSTVDHDIVINLLTRVVNVKL